MKMQFCNQIAFKDYMYTDIKGNNSIAPNLEPTKSIGDLNQYTCS